MNAVAKQDKAGGSKVGKFGIGVRVVDDEGDVGVIVGKRKGEREVDYARYGKLWWPKSHLAVAANDNAAGAMAGELQLEAGKFYRTRDGRKVGPMVKADRSAWPWQQCLGDPGDSPNKMLEAWKNNGRLHSNSEYPDDLIAEWSDAPLEEAPSISPEIVVNDYSDGADGENSSEWVPKVGDRVRFKDRFVSGDGAIVAEAQESSFDWTVKPDTDAGGYFYKDGRFGYRTRLFATASLEPLPVAEQPAAAPEAVGLTIEAGKSYRTRDGRKASVERDRGEWLAGDIVGGENGKVWNRNGSHGGPHVARIPSDDLVAEWVEPAAEVAVAASSEPATTEAKFKVGDRVVIIGNEGDPATVKTRNSEGKMSIQFDWTERPGFEWWGDDELAPLPPTTASSPSTFARNDLVTLAAPVKVTGTSGDRVHISFPSGGSFTLPASALIAA